MKTCLLAALMACGLLHGVANVASAQKIVSRKAPFTDASAGLVFRDMADFKFQKATVDLAAEGGYTIDYETPFEGRLNISVYPVGEAEIADGPESPEVEAEVRRIYGELERHISESRGGTVTLVTDAVDAAQDGISRPRFRRVTSTVRSEGQELRFTLLVTGHRGFVVNVRTAHSPEVSSQATPQIERFLAELERMMSP